MNTDARRRASAAFHAKRKAEGWRKITVWLHPDTAEELDRLAKVYDNRERALAMCIDHHSDEGRKLEARREARKAAELETIQHRFAAASAAFGPQRAKPGSRLKGK